MRTVYDVLREKEAQIAELHQQVKRIEDQVEKLRAAARIMAEEGVIAPEVTRLPDQAIPPIAPVMPGAPTPVNPAATATTQQPKRWLP